MILEKIDISKLIFDPNNARKHSAKNLEAIKGSLTKFGQQKPIVIDAKNIIIAGNGTVAAAKDLGWTDIQAVRSSLEGFLQSAFALADNRTSELAEWDEETLKESLAALQLNDFDVSGIGFQPGDFDFLNEPPEPKDEISPPDTEFIVVLNCKDETEQRALFEELSSRGVDCKLMS